MIICTKVIQVGEGTFVEVTFNDRDELLKILETDNTREWNSKKKMEFNTKKKTNIWIEDKRTDDDDMGAIIENKEEKDQRTDLGINMNAGESYFDRLKNTYRLKNVRLLKVTVRTFVDTYYIEAHFNYEDDMIAAVLNGEYENSG
ncbi:hypothetical protein RCL_jg23083.t1 [Rhizophagus clarus]|uniref:Uncharacterized protein n=1 Tax=Rhizophagus clarus TaxID=94130 RepID=A0A8H3L710_9GLOM|nr:hypothetical protein RCL_jg23083.t1 [Rhizophagus clarus]